MFVTVSVCSYVAKELDNELDGKLMELAEEAASFDNQSVSDSTLIIITIDILGVTRGWATLTGTVRGCGERASQRR